MDDFMDNFWVALDLDTQKNCFECNLKIYNELTRTFYLRYGTAMERFVFDTIRENSIQAIPESRYLTLNVKKLMAKAQDFCTVLQLCNRNSHPLLKVIRFVNSVCTIFSLRKQGTPHQT